MAVADRIDFNCDLGEGCGDDAAILPHISSASIACGGHAGDDASMGESVALCRRHGVSVGAHPSFEDRAHFGRRELDLAPADLHALTLAQTLRLARICDAAGVPMRHVKPHGALYNLAARDARAADAVAGAVAEVDRRLRLFALAGSALASAGRRLGLAVAEEAFAERSYRADGSLTPRGEPGAVIEDLDTALAQVRGLVRDHAVRALDGRRVALHADTLCLHGDRPDAARFAQALRAALEREGIAVRAPGDAP